MRKFRKTLTLFLAIFMVMQVVLPTLSLAVNLNIQFERPYNDDNGDNTVGNDIYTLARQATQTIFKIGDLNAQGALTFENAYYCLRGGLGFGSTNQILPNGVNYTKLADLNDSQAVINYFRSLISADKMSNQQLEKNYQSICWIAENMYLPRNKDAQALKEYLLKNVNEFAKENDLLNLGESMLIEDSLLTDDDIEVVQQIALWFFTNYDEKGDANSVFLDETVDLANLLKIHDAQHTDSDTDSYSSERAKQINILYKYFVTNAKNPNGNTAIVSPQLELDKTLNPAINEKEVSGLDTFVVGPFKINKIKEGNIDYTFSYGLKYKANQAETTWSTISIDNELNTVYLSNKDGVKLDRMQDVEDTIGQEFYLTILKDISGVSNIAEFGLDISYDPSYYFETTGEILVARQEDQPVLKVDKNKIDPKEEVDSIIIKPEVKDFDLALRKFITGVNSEKINTRIPEIKLQSLKEGTTATYTHPKDAIYLKKGDLVVYTIRIYNEGDLDGYATEVTDYLCDDLEFVENNDINKLYKWEVTDDGYLKTDYLADTLIKAYNPNTTAANNTSLWQKATDGADGLYYADLQVVCKIKENARENTTLPNVAEISEDKAVEINNNVETEVQIDDRDSEPKSLTETEIRNYEGNPWIEDDDDFERVIIEPDKVFDLALRKYITKINDNPVTNSREPNINAGVLDKGNSTAEYKHRKDPLVVETGDLVTYKITIYNEGEVAGRAKKVVDQLPAGVEFVNVVSGNYILESYDKQTNKVVFIENDSNENLPARAVGQNPSSTTIEIVCKVIATRTGENQVLTNVAWIAEDYNAESNEITDRDSSPTRTPDVKKDNMSEYTGKDNHEDLSKTEYYKGQEDDDDFEKLILKTKEFDLALRKYIDNIERQGEGLEFPSRVPQVDTTPLNNKPTANYNHPKDVLTVKQGDIITYKLRVYNEAEVDGYATEITDYIPEGLGLLVGYSGNSNWKIESTNIENKPLVGENGIYKTIDKVQTNGIFKDEDLTTITVVSGKDSALEIRDYLSLKDELIKKYGAEVEEGDLFQISTNNENDGLFYQEIEVTCIVLAQNTYEGILTNIAEISVDKAVETVVNEDNEEVEIEVQIDDRDSTPNNVDLTDYELRGENSTYQQDDDDYEPVQLKYFDLALRKFITRVNEKEVTTRIPEVVVDEHGNIKYEHTKEPVEVVDNDKVTYTIRVYNEGTIAGYAEEIEDDIPEGLIFLPQDKTNKNYGWKMYYYDEENNLVETEKVEQAEVIRTTYLSEENGIVDEETGINSNLLSVFDKETMEVPDYRDVKVVFKVSQEDIPEENEDGIIINKAHITDDSDYDEDSIPDEWNEPEDDQDIEKIKVQKFDLALFKWVSKTIVTVDGKTTTTETGFKPNIGRTEAEGNNYRDNKEEEPIASVTVDKKKLNSTVVKFVYNIKVTNEGDIAGYATELTDYIPEGLKFVSEDNPLWTLEEGNKITTRALETKLLKPGESAEVPVTFTWINGADNLGLKTNIAAITEDYNEHGIPDEDSKPGNENIPKYIEEQEDDDDFALVILTLKTGKGMSYIWLGFITVAIISIGAILIKKYVL